MSPEDCKWQASESECLLSQDLSDQSNQALICSDRIEQPWHCETLPMLQIPQVTIVSLLSHPRTDLSEFSNLNLLIISRIKLDTSDNIHQHFCYLVKGQHRLCLYLRRCIARKVRAASIQPLYSLYTASIQPRQHRHLLSPLPWHQLWQRWHLTTSSSSHLADSPPSLILCSVFLWATL